MPQPGLLHLLDEECALQKGSDEQFAQKVREKHGGQPYFVAPKRVADGAGDARLCFTVKHYAGDVTYLSVGFREKNKDALHPDLTAVMQGSTSLLTRKLFPAAGQEGGEGGAGVAVGRRRRRQRRRRRRGLQEEGRRQV